MTKEEFDAAVDHLLHNTPATGGNEATAMRVAAAVGSIMKHRLEIPDNADFIVPVGDIPEFLRSMTRRQRRLLKQIAESMMVQCLGRIH
jgi:hypothetical protein